MLEHTYARASLVLRAFCSCCAESRAALHCVISGRDAECPITTVAQGSEPMLFTCHFLGWDPVAAAGTTLPCPALPCAAVMALHAPCLVVSCLALPCLALPCLALPCLALRCRDGTSCPPACSPQTHRHAHKHPPAFQRQDGR
eukprot:COSAG06_NODE_692_length_13043_cov_369.439509_8_plen_143_part_00